MRLKKVAFRRSSVRSEGYQAGIGTSASLKRSPGFRKSRASTERQSRRYLSLGAGETCRHFGHSWRKSVEQLTDTLAAGVQTRQHIETRLTKPASNSAGRRREVKKTALRDERLRASLAIQLNAGQAQRMRGKSCQ